MLDGKDKVVMEGYTIYRNDRNGDGGGVLIAIKDVLKGIMVEESNSKRKDESIWLSLTNNKTKIRIGIVYNPQENKTTKDEPEEVYGRIESEIKNARKMEQHIIVMGDMNCKIDDLIDGNKEEISKGGKIMIKMIKENNMIILNSLEKCRGKWTRSSGREKSIIDYIMIGEEDENGVESIIIDEKKEKSPYRMRRSDGITHQIFPDHNVMSSVINWVQEEENTKKKTKTVMTNQAYIKYREMLQNGKVSKIWEMSIPQQTKYDRWSDKIIEMKMKCERRQSKGKESKKIADLRKIKKKIRKNLAIQTEESERSLQRQRLQMLTRHIEEEKLEQNTRKLVKTVESLQKAPGIISENTFWKFQQKQKNKLEEQKTAMKNKDGELVETEKEVKEVYT